MTTCFHKYTPPEGQTQVIARAQSISLIRCLFRLVKCKFTEPLYKSAWYTLLSLLIFSTYALSIKREGHNLKKKKKKKKGNIAVAAVVAFLCGYALKSAVLRYCGYRDSPTDTSNSLCSASLIVYHLTRWDLEAKKQTETQKVSPRLQLSSVHSLFILVHNMMQIISLFHTAIPENTWKMCPVMVWFWFIHTASDFPESVRAFTHNP